MRIALALLVAVLVAVPAAPAQTLADGLERARTISRAQMALAEDHQVRAYDLRVRLAGNTVVLAGAVPTAEARNAAHEVVRTVLGDRPFQNNIEVTREARRVPGPLPPRVARQEAREAAAQPEASRPAEPAAPAQPEAVYHTVGRGDTLFGIARRHGTSVAAIQRLNNMSGTTIRPGQRLRVR